MLKFVLVLLFTAMIFGLSVKSESDSQVNQKQASTLKISAGLKELMTIVEKNEKNQKIRILIKFPKSEVPYEYDPVTHKSNDEVFIDHAEKTQKSTLPHLEKLKKDKEIKEYSSHWVDNIIDTIASPKAIRTLATLKDVQEVHENDNIQDVSLIVDDDSDNTYQRPTYKN